MNIQPWLDQIDSTTAAFKESFHRLSGDALNWKPDPKTWSVGQNIHHLIVINGTYRPIIQRVREGTYQKPWMGRWKFMVDFFGRMIYKYVTPDRTHRSKTFRAAWPSASAIDTDILDQFEKHQSELKLFIQSCQDLLEANTIISSPANKNIVYTLKSAFDIIVAHEQRHLVQAREVNELRIKSMGS
jgi:DinB family protein